VSRGLSSAQFPDRAYSGTALVRRTRHDALLRDVGMFLRERVVLTHLSEEPAQQALDDITNLLDSYMGDDVHHRMA